MWILIFPCDPLLILAKCCCQNWLYLKYHPIDFLLNSISYYIQKFPQILEKDYYNTKMDTQYSVLHNSKYTIQASWAGWYLYCYPQPKVLRSLVHLKCVFCQPYCALSSDIAYQSAKNCQITFSVGWRNCVESYTMNLMTRFVCTSSVLAFLTGPF